MKKVIIKIFCCILCVAFMFSMSVGFTYSSQNDDELFISTELCPQEIIDYAINNFNNIIYWSNSRSISIQIGQPFTLINENTNEKLYYFPIVDNGNIISTYRVYSVESGYNGILSNALVDELNFFAGKTTKENPAKVFVNQNNDIVIMTSFMKKTIVDHPTDIYDTLKTNELQDLKIKDNHIKNIFTPITKNSKSYIEPRGGQKSLNVVIRETQSNLPWCAGYVAAMITSYKTGGIYYARDVANFAGVNESSGISRSQLIKFAKSKGLSPNETVFDVSSSSLGKQIENNRPVYVGVKNLSNTSSSHALTIRGYSYDGSKNDVSGFSVWNPWYNSFEWMGANQIYVDRSGTRYEAEYYVINW